MKRLTISDMVRETGLCESTLRKYADCGKIPHSRDANHWRVFTEASIEAARQLAGIKAGSQNAER